MMDIYSKIIRVLDRPMTAQQVAEKAGLHRTPGYLAIMKRLYDIGAVSREPHPETRKINIYRRLVDNITAAEVKKKLAALKDAPEHLPKGARLITFDSEEMQRKLRETNKLSRRAAGKAHIRVNWNFD